MSVLDIFWIFLILAALQPVVRQRMLDAVRQRRIAEIERRRGTRVILLVHRQETMRLLGFPVMRFIDVNDAEQVIRAIHLTDPDTPIDLILHTPGGLALAALQIARAFKIHRGKTTVFVPHMAMSGGTLIALAADQIVMCEHSVLGSIDPQISQFPAASILRAVEQKPAAELDDRTLILADVGRKAIDQITRAATRLLEEHLPTERAAEIARTLAAGTWTHDYPISAAEAQALGLNVDTAMPREILELMTLYPQPVRAQPGVEYLPRPRGPQPAPEVPR